MKPLFTAEHRWNNLVWIQHLHASAYAWKYVNCCIKIMNILATIYVNTYPKTLPKLKPPKTTATALDRSCKGMDLHVRANESLKFQTTLAKCQNVYEAL